MTMNDFQFVRRSQRIRLYHFKDTRKIFGVRILLMLILLVTSDAWSTRLTTSQKSLKSLNRRNSYYFSSTSVFHNSLLNFQLFAAKRDNDDEEKQHPHKPLEDDINRRLSIYKDRAISALSQPGNTQEEKGNSNSQTTSGSNRMNKDLQRQQQVDVGNTDTLKSGRSNRRKIKRNISSNNDKSDKGRQSSFKTRKRQNNATTIRGSSTTAKSKGKHRERASKKSVQGRRKGLQKTKTKSNFSSLLPPPLSEGKTTTSKIRGRTSRQTTKNNIRYGSQYGDNDTDDDDDDDVRDSLSSGLSSWEQFLGVTSSSSSSSTDTTITTTNSTNSNKDRRRSNNSLLSGDDMISKSDNNEYQALPSIQDLFPPDLSSSSSSSSSTTTERLSSSTHGYSNHMNNQQNMQQQRQQQQTNSSPLDGVLPVSDLFYRSSEADDDSHDDEELPFSAEQSDAVSSDHNKIRIRRNLASKVSSLQRQQQQRQLRKETVTNKSSSDTDNNDTNTPSRDSRKVVRRGMEMLVGGVPINADPPQRSIQLIYNNDATVDWASVISLNTREFGPLFHTGSIDQVSDIERGLFCEYFTNAAIKWDICPKELRQIVKMNKVKSKTKSSATNLNTISSSVSGLNASEIRNNNNNVEGQNVDGKETSGHNKKSEQTHYEMDDNDEFFETTGKFSFEIGVSREELESGEGGEDGGIFRAVFARAFMSVLERAVDAASKDESEAFIVEIPRLSLKETDDGYTSVAVEFKVEAGFETSFADMERRVKRIKAVFTQAMDDGEIALAIAAAAKEETRWPEAVRDRVVEECLFQDDDGDEPVDLNTTSNSLLLTNPKDNTIPVVQTKDENRQQELYLGGGDDGVFFDYSASNIANAPYQGKIGLRLVDAVIERAKQRQPRVIAIGDVHGCIDELQDLLRQCDYQPGDLVVFLGDLVCKGPDSISVVQMAREIGAIGVRGNHDFEVVRWHQAIKSGVDAPVFGSEHYRIASCLSKADMKWMYSLPWYISSKELDALFVHAGFVSGIRLAKQNPRLMMNMRSILPDGTVTSKFFNNWPWARLWDGPQTVLFGHDADRGLQQYEHAIGLDTGCVYGGRLTACVLPEKRLISVSARREYFKYRRKHYD